METYLSSIGLDVWIYVKNGSTVPSYPPIDLDAKEYENNAKLKHAILSGMSNNEFVKVMHCSSTKETWDKLQRLFEGDVKFKEVKLQKLRGQLEGFKMKDEKISDYFHRVDETVNTIKGLREDIDDEVIVKKVLRSLTSKYDTKVSTIEEAKDLKIFSMDELFDSLTTYEMRTTSERTSRKEVLPTTPKRVKNKLLIVSLEKTQT